VREHEEAPVAATVAPTFTEVLALLKKSDSRHDLVAAQQRDALRALLLLAPEGMAK
jgi:hypothetical protein